MIEEGPLDSIKTSAKKFWGGTSGEISRERRWPQAYEKSMIAYKQAIGSGDFDAIDKYSDLTNYFAIMTDKPKLKDFDNKLARNNWDENDFVDYVKRKYAAELNQASTGGLEEGKAWWNKKSPSKHTKKLSPAKKAKAKARAKEAGRDYPNAVDNRWAAQLEEQTENKQKVVIKLDPTNPMDDSMIATLGGAGSWSFKGLRNKARREADELARRLNASDHPVAFRDSAYNIKQLANTLNTIVAAYDELNEIRRRGGTRSRGITPSEE